MARKVFYSWQSDRPNATNRGLILTALKAACADLGEDPTIDERPEVDHDTQGVPGAPDIVQTIFAKIDGAHVFVADVSIITSDAESRACPNPNVLIELGYAVKTLGWNSIILVMNTTFGGPELLPFDLKTKRVTTYRMGEQDTERAPERKKLQSIFQAGLKIIFEHSTASMPGTEIEPALPGDLALKAIEDGKPNASSAVRRFMQWFGDQIDKSAPDATVTPSDEALVQALDRTIPALVEFAKVAEVIAAHDASGPAKALFKGFEYVLARYDIPVGFPGGVTHDRDFDLAKFVGHEAMVMFVACLLREERWSLLAELLGEDLIVRSGRGTNTRRYDRISMHVKMLDIRNDRLRTNRASVHSDLLKERHEKGELSKRVPFAEFMAADFFLCLRRELAPGGAMSGYWYPRSAAYLGNAEPPRYLLLLKRLDTANKIAPALGVPNAVQLRERMTAAEASIRKTLSQATSYRDGPLHDFDPSAIGTQ